MYKIGAIQSLGHNLTPLHFHQEKITPMKTGEWVEISYPVYLSHGDTQWVATSFTHRCRMRRKWPKIVKMRTLGAVWGQYEVQTWSFLMIHHFWGFIRVEYHQRTGLRKAWLAPGWPSKYPLYRITTTVDFRVMENVVMENERLGQPHFPVLFGKRCCSFFSTFPKVCG